MAAEPSDLELQVLAVLWQRGEATVRDVLTALPDGRPRAYTTVLSTLQTMERKGLVTGRKEGSANLYAPVAARQAVLGPLLRRLVRHAFGGQPTAAMQCLLEEAQLDADELAHLKRLIEKHSAAANSSAAWPAANRSEEVT